MNDLMRYAALLLAVIACNGNEAPTPPTSSAATSTVAVNTKAPSTQPTTSTPGSRDDDVDRCASAAECQLYQPACCPTCQDQDDVGQPTRGTRAVTKGRRAKYEMLCATKKVTCDPCVRTGFDPHLLPSCRDDRCEVIDLRVSEMSACSVDADCVLGPSTCCGCGSAPVAVGKGGFDAFRDAVCAANGQPNCAPCETPPYDGVTPKCKEGHCVAEGTWKP